MKELDRRTFIKIGGESILATSLTGAMLSMPLSQVQCHAAANESLTIQQVIDHLIAQIPGDTDKDTVDTIKIGDATQDVTGVVTTFMATLEVIHKTVKLGANLIITHEPTFYNHLDETDWLEEDEVYQYKKQLLEKHNIVVWRFHDFWHQYRPDGILTGFLQKMGWQDTLDPTLENTCIIPQQELQTLAGDIKRTFKLKRTFYIGNPEQPCTKVGILPGAWGGRHHIPFLGKDIDVLIVGESAEWEAVEYVRDASIAGISKGLIIMGHATSEEPGMRYLRDWLTPMFPNIDIHHIAAGDPFIPV